LKRYTEPRKPIGTVAELFAGVGGFRIGLSRSGWKTTFSNQWEPSTKTQHASKCYVFHFGAEGHTNDDIEKVLNAYLLDKKSDVPKTTLVVGGFPCQDYSVAKTLKTARGLEGKKGVLWWQIYRLIEANEPPLVLLENVDRLLNSPATQRGRDFAIMLASLGDLGYTVEWRVVNAAEYGFPQRRKRVFIVAKRTDLFPRGEDFDPNAYMTKDGVLARALPVLPLDEGTEDTRITLRGNLAAITKRFDEGGKASPWKNAGVLAGRSVYTHALRPKVSPTASLGSILEPMAEVPESFFVSEGQLKAWETLKDAKKIPRRHADSQTVYTYSEGKMAFPDLLENPARTILTGEGGSTPSRFKHIILQDGRYRRLMPVELERLNGFPDDWTRWLGDGVEATDSRRAFFMGNALVCGIVERIGRVLAEDWKAHEAKQK
jgi:DNA (cytosine-5)-methyltransferase 1